MRRFALPIIASVLICWGAPRAVAQPKAGAIKNIEEVDGSPSCYGYKLIVSNTTLTDNADGTCTVTTGGGGANHAILSATHTDSTAAAVVRGDLITGQGATPAWARLAIGTSGQYPRSDGTDIAWSGLNMADATAGTLAVGRGGTGLASWTANSLAFSSGATTLASLGAATNGQVPIGSTSAAPVLATLTGTANQVTVTNGAGTITLSTPQDIATTSTPTFLDLRLAGTGPDIRFTPTGGDAIHFGAETIGTGTVGFISNATKGVIYLEFEPTHVINIGDNKSSTPAIRLRTDGTGDNEVFMPAGAVGLPEITQSGNINWTGTATFSGSVTAGGTGISTITQGLIVNNGSTSAENDDLRYNSTGTTNLFECDAGDNKCYFNGIASTTAAEVGMLANDNDTALEIRVNATQANCTATDIFIDFRSTSGSEGSVACTGVAGVIAYNTFLGSHYTHVIGERPAIGMVLEMTGAVLPEMVSYLAQTQVCRTVASRQVYGIYGGTNPDGYDLSFGIGAGVVLVSNRNGDIHVGDLLESDGQGYAQRQSDDLIRASTLGKAVVSVDWSKEPTSVKLIGVVIYAG